MREKRFSYMLRFICMLSGAYPPSSACRYREIPGMAADGEGPRPVALAQRHRT
jgi:hypothetical protein